MPGGREPYGLAPLPARRQRGPWINPRIAATVLSLAAGLVTFVGAGLHHVTKGWLHGAAPPAPLPASNASRPAGTAAPAPGELQPVTLPRPAVVVTPGENVPNPFVAVDGQEYVMFASQGAWLTPNVPFRVSSSPTSWGPVLGDALPNLPPWAGYGFTWAPDVRKVGDRFVMWFTALVKGVSPMTQCIGAAWSLYLVGPYQPLPAPAVCPLDHHGAIDPRMFAAPDGSLWLDWKTDDNADVPGDSHTTIYAQRLTPDGLTPAAPPVPLVTADLTWEGRIVEAPQMVAAAGHYWLFYSGNWFNQPAYGIGVARCDGPAGPCTKTLPQAWLGSDRQGQGPGEGSLFHDANGWWMVYAPWSAQAGQNVVRPVALAHIGFTAAGPYIIPPA